MSRQNIFRLALGLAGLFSVLAAGAQDVPKYKVDPFWPKPLPHNWMLGHVETVVVDKDDHIWVAHYTGPLDRRMDHLDMGLAQNPPLAECCVPAPEVLEFDAQGNVLRGWGGPGYVPEWPEGIHAMWVDGDGNVWVGGNHAPDRNVLKFTPDGKLLMEIGHLAGPVGVYTANRPELGEPNNQATDLLGGPSGITVDDAAHEVYIADGYINKRVVVFDSVTGRFKRGWGAYGIPLSEVDNHKLPQNDPGAHNSSTLSSYDPQAPPDKQFRGPVESIRISNDGLVYVGDRNSRRIQVFTKEGKFVNEFFVSRETLLQDGTTHGMTFSTDPGQKYLIVADGANNTLWFLNRKDGSVAGQFGHTGRNAGQFDVLNWVAIDSHSTLYTNEVKYNDRVQRFVVDQQKNSQEKK